MRYAVVFTKNQFQYLKHFIQEICEVSPLAEAEIYLHSEPLKAIHAVAQMLNRDPTNVLAHKLLARVRLEHKHAPRRSAGALEFR